MFIESSQMLKSLVGGGGAGSLTGRFPQMLGGIPTNFFASCDDNFFFYLKKKIPHTPFILPLGNVRIIGLF